MAKSDKRAIGKLGEELAARFLTEKGFSIVEFNYNRPWGEIDIVAEKSGVVRFVEVKTISRVGTNGSREIKEIPEELVHKSKLSKIARTAALYMESKNDLREYQVDVVGVILDKEARIARCRLFEQVLG